MSKSLVYVFSRKNDAQLQITISRVSMGGARVKFSFTEPQWQDALYVFSSMTDFGRKEDADIYQIFRMDRWVGSDHEVCSLLVNNLRLNLMPLI